MSDSEHSASDIEPKASSPRHRRAPINLDDVDDSNDDEPNSPSRNRERKPRVKRESSASPTRHSRDRRDDDDDDDDRNDDEITPRRPKKSSSRRSKDDGSGDEYDDDDDDDAPKDRKPRVKKERGNYSDIDDGDLDDNDDRARDRKRKRAKKEQQAYDKRGRSSYDDDDDPLPDTHDGLPDDDADNHDNGGAGSSSKKRKLNAVEKAIETNKELRRPRKKDVDMAEVENDCIAFLERMMKARDDDVRAYRMGRPPLEKIKMLREVEQMMTKVAHREYLLENMMLPVFKAWLDRLPDGALPNIDVRTTLLRILADCRVDEDWLARLQESQGLGKVVHFLSRSDDHEPNRRVAKKLIEKWARLVYRSNSDFHDLQEEFDKPEDGHKAGKDSVAAERKAALQTVRNFQTTQERMRAFKHREKTTKTETDMMASIPRATPFLFTTMAEGSHDIDDRASREMRSQKSRTRRVNSTLANMRRRNKSNGARAARPSLNGR